MYCLIFYLPWSHSIYDFHTHIQNTHIDTMEDSFSHLPKNGRACSLNVTLFAKKVSGNTCPEFKSFSNSLKWLNCFEFLSFVSP